MRFYLISQVESELPRIVAEHVDLSFKCLTQTPKATGHQEADNDSKCRFVFRRYERIEDLPPSSKEAMLGMLLGRLIYPRL